MSEQEQQLIHLQAWDDYQTAKRTHAVCKLKIEDLAKRVMSVGRDLAANPASATPAVFEGYPAVEELAATLEDFKNAADKLGQCSRVAHDFGFPVEVLIVGSAAELGVVHREMGQCEGMNRCCIYNAMMAQCRGMSAFRCALCMVRWVMREGLWRAEG
jgi:hypothetical protein